MVNLDEKFDLVASEKEVSRFQRISDQLLTKPGQSRKERVEGQAELREEIKAEVLCDVMFSNSYLPPHPKWSE